jgi:hypothetical protein
LKPLAWLIGILTLATVLMLYAKAPDWLLIVMACLLVGTILLYGFSYSFCLFNDRDALRSEKYSLQKLAIEHGLLGDSSTGLFEPTSTPRDIEQLPSGTAKQIEKY